jgi:chromosome segregation ATPase
MVSWQEFQALEKRVNEMASALVNARDAINHARANITSLTESLTRVTVGTTETARMITQVSADLGALNRRVATLEIHEPPTASAGDAP